MSNDLHHSQNSWIKTVRIDNLGFKRGVREIQRIIMTSISTQNSTPLCKKTVYTRGSLYAEKTVVNAICTLTLHFIFMMHRVVYTYTMGAMWKQLYMRVKLQQICVISRIITLSQ